MVVNQALSAELRGDAPLDLSWKDHASALEALPQQQQAADGAASSRPPGHTSVVGSAGKDVIRAAMGLTAANGPPTANGGTDRPPSS